MPHALTAPPQPAHPGLLDLEVRFGPLSAEDRATVLSEYNRLTHGNVSEQAYRHGMEDGPGGPGLHALLRNEEGRVVGHISVFPLSLFIAGQETRAAKAEYFFLTEAYRTCRIRGQETLSQPPAVQLLKALYARIYLEGIDPVLMSALPGVDFLHRMAGAKPVAFPLHECLFILRPLKASRETPNLTPLRRALLFAVGTVQACLALGLRLRLLLRQDALEEVPALEPRATYPKALAAFSREAPFIRWRYPAGPYLRLAPRDRPHWHLIARRGGPNDYLRICTTNLDSAAFPAGAYLASLLGQARREGALGVRWSIYDQGEPPAEVVAKLRRLGCLCVARSRTILIHTRQKDLLKPEAWQMEDSLVAFEG